MKLLAIDGIYLKKSRNISYLNLFQFEELNREMIQLINGMDLICEEFVKLFSLLQCLSSFTFKVEFKDALIKNFIEKYLIIKSSNKKKTSSSFTLKVTSAIKYIELNETQLNKVYSKV